VLIVHQGRDAWAEDNLHIARAAIERGYHALLFDGPGMGKVLRLQKLPFRPDWERVITPVVDYLVARPDVDPGRLALIGISMGGFLAPRAAAFEQRLKLVVANPGVYDWSRIYTGFLDAIDPALVPLSRTDPAAFDQQIAGIMSQNGLLRWGLVDSMWHHGVSSPSALMRDIARYSLEGLASQIQSRVLVVDAEAEEWGQSRQLFEALSAPKQQLVFTRAEAAQFHVQPGALAVATHRMFDWIDREL
jgi:pimeloyl-ACP methyl ester carboxylesterase